MESTASLAANQRSYEDFEPTTEWKREHTADTLLVYLPGFRKDQLKVQVTSSRQLRITGERPSGNNNNTNKWSRFKKEMPIAANYEANEIGARFDKGVLYVKHPKLITRQQQPQLPAAAAAANSQFPPLQKPPRPAGPTMEPSKPLLDTRKPAPATVAPAQLQKPPAWRPVQDPKLSPGSSNNVSNTKPTAAATSAQPLLPPPASEPTKEGSIWKIPPPEPIAFPPLDTNQEKYRTNGQRLATPETNEKKGEDQENGGGKKGVAGKSGVGGKLDGNENNIRKRASSLVTASGGKLKEAAVSSGMGVVEMTKKNPKKMVNLGMAVLAAVVILLYMKNVAVKSFCKFAGDDHLGNEHLPL